MYPLSDLGLTRTALQRSLAQGELIRVDRGWYAREQAGSDEDRWLRHLTARIARYPDGRLAGQGAAALVGLDGFDPGLPTTVYRPPGTSGRGPGVRRLDVLEDPVDVAGLNVCGIGELLLGLGAEVVRRPGCRGADRALDPVELVELAVEAALRRGLTDVDRLHAVLRAARPNRPGRGVLAQVLADRPGGLPAGPCRRRARRQAVARRPLRRGPRPLRPARRRRVSAAAVHVRRCRATPGARRPHRRPGAQPRAGTATMA